MTTQEILNILQSDIHSVAFATLDEHGLPQTCVIDLMLTDDDGLYFQTAKGILPPFDGKAFCLSFGDERRRYPVNHGNLGKRGSTQYREKTVS